ncbi:uncharacterized protein LOC132204007 [Neocloeon triangulifer]|uniref:uncharacterized protein LOC132204007 n=1 Tax=Neocloeon triangulifer TaxID=2078957 RepID=UPI00286FAAC1|nr:uncharacterized protein LOC132204007 [Neocloeon triangulifer]
MNFGNEVNYSSGKMTPSPNFNKFRRQRPFDDISNFDSPHLPKIQEESVLDEKENKKAVIETTPRRRMVGPSQSNSCIKTPDTHKPTSSTPLSSRQNMPTPKTPRFIPRNPFDADLISRLHLPICSPNVFNTVVSPTKSLDGDNFDWTIEDVSRIKPAAIEEYPEHQFTNSDDPETESRVQQTLDTFWKAEKHIVPSPWQDSRRSLVQKITIESKPKPSKDVSTQTMISLPLILPPELEKALQPYFRTELGTPISPESMLEEEEEDAQSSFLSQSGLRRKLLFIQEETLASNCCPSSPIVSMSSMRGLSRTDKDSNLIRSPTISPIKSSDESTPSAVRESGNVFCSKMSVDTSVHGNGHQMSIQLHEEMVSNSGLSMHRQVLFDDQTMESIAPSYHAFQGQSTDHGYLTETSSLNFANHFHSRLPDYTLPLEPWVPHLGSSTPSKEN